MSPWNVLVTGGAGFVGSNLAIRYKERHPDSRPERTLEELFRTGPDSSPPVQVLQGRKPSPACPAGTLGAASSAGPEPS